MVEIETKTNNINNNNNIVSIDADVVSSVSNIKDVIANVPDNIQTIFIVKQGRFEGPYHKLLEMIENRKLSISEISLSQIADNYIEYVRDIRDKNNDITPEELSQFILIASTLMLIKARSLLPDIILESEEEKEISQLEHKLELLRLLKLAENNIKSIWAKNTLYNKKTIQIKEKVFRDPDNFNKENIYSVLLLTLAKMPNFERLRNVAVRQVIRLEDVINRLLEKIGNKITSLKDFAKDLSVADNMNSPSGSVDNNKENIKKSLIVGFLAILELLKQNIIVAEETEGDIKISKI